jgi:hypothetical protein
VLRGAKDLMAFLETAPKVDEAALNLLGSALARAAADNQLTRTPLFQQAADFYEKKNKELEKSHPGKARWGTEWMSTTKARIKKDEFNNAMDHWKWTLDRQAKAADEQRSAQAAYDQARSAAMLRNSSSAASNLRSASDRLSRAKDALAEADAQVKDAWAAVPRPEWPKTFAPALPEFAGGGEFGAPRHRTEAVAVATPKPVVPAAPRSTEKRPPVGEPTPPPPETPPPQPPTDVAHVVATESVTRYAVAVPVGPDLLLTAAAPIEKATEFKLESPSGNIFTAQLVRKDGTLALLRVPGQQFAFLNLASTFAGGEVACWGYPEVSIFSPVADSILTSAPAPREKGWNLSLRRHPRLAGAAVVDKSGSLVGLTLGDRESAMTQMPAATAEQIRAFLGTDAPKSLCANPDPRGVLQLIATRAGN